MKTQGLKIPYSTNLPNWLKYLGNIGKKALLGVRNPWKQAGLECRTSHAMRPRPSSRSRALWLLCLCCTVYSKTLMLSRHKTKVGVGTRLMWEVFLAYRPLPSLKKNVRKAMTTAQQPLLACLWLWSLKLSGLQNQVHFCLKATRFDENFNVF